MNKQNDTNGKLVIKTFINHHAPDEQGRTGGRWVTLFNKHGVRYSEAESAAAEFKQNNRHVVSEFSQIDCRWVAYEQYVYI
jgi:hypothetical protein